MHFVTSRIEGIMMKRLLLLALVTGSLMTPVSARAQQGAPLPSPPGPPATEPQGAPLPYPPQAAPPTYPPQELDRIVSPIALYPDPLLGQILTAATFSPEVPDAARWADEHHYVPPGALPGAIAADRLPWQPSVQALLPFPQVLGMMASDMPWTDEIGAAFLAQPEQVMDAVQRMRQSAAGYGYLRSNAQVVVRQGPFIEILPVNPAFIVVPYYNPAVVFVAPRRGVFVGGAINFGFGVTLGAAFEPWGWGATRFAWGEHALIVNNAPWRRTWGNRAVYVHPFASVPRFASVRPAEGHTLRARSEREREAEQKGRGHKEEHRRDDRR
jgi:Protein of unknown function (DUF3300)